MTDKCDAPPRLVWLVEEVRCVHTHLTDGARRFDRNSRMRLAQQTMWRKRSDTPLGPSRRSSFTSRVEYLFFRDTIRLQVLFVFFWPSRDNETEEVVHFFLHTWKANGTPRKRARLLTLIFGHTSRQLNWNRANTPLCPDLWPLIEQGEIKWNKKWNKNTMKTCIIASSSRLGFYLGLVIALAHGFVVDFDAAITLRPVRFLRVVYGILRWICEAVRCHNVFLFFFGNTFPPSFIQVGDALRYPGGPYYLLQKYGKNLFRWSTYTAKNKSKLNVDLKESW